MAGVTTHGASNARYQAPAIELRTPIGAMLIGVPISSNLDT
jgi:hypothetical protein